jgi:hypothetical protein
MPITKSNDFYGKTFQKCNSKTFSKNTFKIFHQNIRGLKNKHNELLCHLQELAPHVLLSYRTPSGR